MAKRQIVGIKWARELAARPKHIPLGRPRGQKAQGIRYERAVAAELPSGSRMGIWFEFEDANGWGCCQVDGLVPGQRLGVLEIKYTWTVQAFEELELLYLPVVQRALGQPVWGIQVCKVLTPLADRVCGSLGEAQNAAWRPTWHCLGIRPRLPRTEGRPNVGLAPAHMGF